MRLAARKSACLADAMLIVDIAVIRDAGLKTASH